MNGDLLRLLLAKQNLGPAEFAKRIRVSPSTVYNMLSGKVVSLRVAMRASQALKTPLDHLAPGVLRRHGMLKKYREISVAA